MGLQLWRLQPTINCNVEPREQHHIICLACCTPSRWATHLLLSNDWCGGLPWVQGVIVTLALVHYILFLCGLLHNLSLLCAAGALHSLVRQPAP